MPDLRTLIFRYFFPLRMQLQLQQCTMHMSALLVICYTKGYVLLGRCANLKKKFEHTEKYYFLCTIPMRSILGRVPFRAPPPYNNRKTYLYISLLYTRNAIDLEYHNEQKGPGGGFGKR